MTIEELSAETGLDKLMEGLKREYERTDFEKIFSKMLGVFQIQMDREAETVEEFTLRFRKRLCSKVHISALGCVVLCLGGGFGRQTGALTAPAVPDD